MPWIDINDRLPNNTEYKKFSVKVEQGSVDIKHYQGTVLGKVFKAGGFRFVTQDWTTVTHWWED